MKRLMILDGLNTFVRCYIVNPSKSTNGAPIGGLKGFLQSLQKLSREIKPDYIVIAWDGPGGSAKRKSLVKDYKGGRKPIRLNRNIHKLPPEDEEKNKIWQQARLIEFLNEFPVVQLLEPKVEADDLISLVAQLPKFKDWQKIIVSSDKDFLQLCDDTTILYRPIQDEALNSRAIIEKYGVHPDNFALARAIAGDASDNLPGVPRVGLPTVAKQFPFFAKKKSVTIDDLMAECEKVEKPLKVHTNIMESRELIKTNYKMMQLYKPSLSAQVTKRVKYTFDNADISFNFTEFQTMMMEDGFAEYRWDDMFRCFRKIVVTSKESP